MERLTLGQYFKNERERLGISLKDIERRTKISYQTLLWLEEDNIEVLPPRAFLRGFLQVISKEFGMDEVELFRLMDEGIYRTEKIRSIPLEKIRPKSNRRALIYIVAAILAAAIIFSAVLFSVSYWKVSSLEPRGGIRAACILKSCPYNAFEA